MTLGRIVVDLLARTGSFETDLNRSSKLAAKRAKEIDAAFVKAGKAVGVALGTAVVGLGVALKNSIDHMDEVSKAAQKVGDSTENFSRLVYAGSLADVTMDQLVTTMGKLTKSQAAALKTTSQQAKVFEALGIEVKDTEGKLRKSSDVMLDFADKFKALDGSPEAMAAGFALFGKSFQDLIPLLKDGSAGMREAMDEADALGKTISTEAGRQAEEFNDNLTRLTGAAEGLAMGLASELLPKMVELTDSLVAMTKDGELAADAGRAISFVFDLMGRSLNQLDGIGDMISGVAQGFWELVNVSNALMSGNFALALNLIRNSDSDAKIGAGLMQAASGKKVGAAGSGPDFSNVQSGYGEFSLDKQVKQIKEARAQAEALRKALGDPDPKTKKTGGGKKGKSDAEREAGQLKAAYDRVNESLAQQIALFGQDGEAARLRYEIENTELKNLTQAQKDELLLKADKLDMLSEEAELQQKLDDISKEREEQVKRDIENAGQLIEDMEFELKLLGLSNKEREREIALRSAGANATEEQRRRIAELSDAYSDAAEVAGFYDEVQKGLADAFYDVAKNADSAEDIVKGFFDSLADYVTRMIAEAWAERIADIFRAKGGTGQAGSGQDGWAWIGQIIGMFGGARASGGPVMGGGSYLVGERGPELFMPRTAGTVIPAGPTSRMMGSGGPSVTNINIQGPVTRHTIAQIDRANGRRAAREMGRTGR